MTPQAGLGRSKVLTGRPQGWYELQLREPTDTCGNVLQGPQAMEVMNEAVRWSRSADPSFVRHFVFQALSLAAPPYSPDFATILIRCASCPLVQPICENILPPGPRTLLSHM